MEKHIKVPMTREEAKQLKAGLCISDRNNLYRA